MVSIHDNKSRTLVSGFYDDLILPTSRISAGNSGNIYFCFVLVVVFSSSLLSVTREDCASLPCPENYIYTLP